MYSGFNLSINRYNHLLIGDGFEVLKEKGKKHLADQKSKFRREILECVMQEKIDGNEMQDSWFPQLDADIFISHSHRDEDLACALAGWLNQHFGLQCFIDSNVWGYAGKLRDELNDKVSDKTCAADDGYLYNYQSCNEVAQHVDTMLTVALYQMIDRVEAVFLLNTDHAVQTVHDGNQMNKTYSPWIYSEMICSQLVRKKPLLVYRDYETDILEQRIYEHMESKIQISYKVPLTHLTPLNVDDLCRWQQEYERNEWQYYPYALDALYEFKRPGEVERTKELFRRLDSDGINSLRWGVENGEQGCFCFCRGFDCEREWGCDG